MSVQILGSEIPINNKCWEAYFRLHQLFEAVCSDICETRLELEHNQAELRALRQNALSFETICTITGFPAGEVHSLKVQY